MKVGRVSETTVVKILTFDEAHSLTKELKQGLENVWDLIARAYEGRAWEAMNYSAWEDYVAKEFDDVRIPKGKERKEIVAALRKSMSIRAIASATGLSNQTVQKELKSAKADGTLKEGKITGVNGKVYQTSASTPATVKTANAKPSTKAKPAVKEVTLPADAQPPVLAEVVEAVTESVVVEPVVEVKVIPGKKDRTGRVQYMLVATYVSDIDLDDPSYKDFTSLNAAAESDLKDYQEDTGSLFHQAANKDLVRVTMKWL